MADFEANDHSEERQSATAVATKENETPETNVLDVTPAEATDSALNHATGTPTQEANSDETPELDEESVRLLQSKIETGLLKYFQNKEIAKERSEENKLLLEELEELFEELGDDEIVIPLPSGENAVLTSTIREREILDVDMLADEMRVPKDELKTPFDFCAFTAKGQLTPAMITKHTSVERETKMRISKRKATTKRRKRSK